MNFGVERYLDVIVAGCTMDSNLSKLIDCVSASNEAINEFPSMPTKFDYYDAFKVTVKASEREKLLQPDFRPSCVFVRNFFAPKLHAGETFRYHQCACIHSHSFSQLSSIVPH